MSMPESYLAYQAEFKALDRALAEPEGIRIQLSSFEAASHFRFRLNYARTTDRRKNKEIYEQGDPMYGASIYDPLVCSVREDTVGKWWVYIRKNLEIPGYCESLTDASLPPKIEKIENIEPFVRRKL